MDYFYCNECGGVMDAVEALCFRREIHNELDERPTEWIGERRCLYCGSYDLEEAVYCDDCGELFPDTLLNDGFCPDCYERWVHKSANM